MFHEEQEVLLDLAADARARDVALELERFSVSAITKIDDPQLTHESSCQANRVQLRRPPRRAWGARGSPNRPLRLCTRWCARQRARGSFPWHVPRRCVRRGS